MKTILLTISLLLLSACSSDALQREGRYNKEKGIKTKASAKAEKLCLHRKGVLIEDRKLGVRRVVCNDGGSYMMY